MKKIAAIMVIIYIVALCGCSNTNQQEALCKYSKTTEDEFSNNSLTIYYLPFSAYTVCPLSKNGLVSHSMIQKIYIDHDELSLHLEELKKLDLSIITPVEEEGRVNARLYYQLFLDNGKYLDVVISAPGANMIVNGMEVEYNSVFYDAVLPFLPKTD